MVLRLPKTLLDASLLEDEPFKKCFADCGKQHTQRRRRSTARPHHVEQVVKALCEQGLNGLDAPVLWITNAFGVSPTEAKEGRLLDIFVEFYWHLYHRSEREALAVMRKECKERKMGYTPEVDSPLIPVRDTVTVNAQSSSSRRKRRKQGREYGNDGTETDDDLDDAMSLSDAHISTTNTEKPQFAAKAVATVITRKGNQTKAVHKQPSTESSELQSVDSPLSSLSESESDIPLLIKTRGKKRKSKKHGASSPSATSANDTPAETKPTKNPSDDISDSSLTEVSSDEQLPQENSSTPPVNTTASAADRASGITCSGDPTAMSTCPSEFVLAANSNQAVPIVAEVGPCSNTPESPTSTLVASPPTTKGRRRKTQHGSEPTRIMPGRRAARKEALSRLVMEETNYQKLAQRGRYEDPEIEPLPPFTGAAQEKNGDDSSVAAAKTDIAASGESGRALHTGTKPSSQSAAVPSKPPRGRKTVKKPHIFLQSSEIVTQVAKKRRRNDGTAAHLPVGAALANVMMNSMSASAAAVKAAPLTQPEVQNETSEPLIDVQTRDTSVAGAQPASRARKLKKGRKRKQTQVEAQADTQHQTTSSGPVADTRLTIRIPCRRRRACVSAPSPEYRPLVDSSVVGAILRDAGTAALQSLTCSVKPAGNWDVEEANGDPSLVYESDHDDEDFVLEEKTSARKSASRNRSIVLHAPEPDDLPSRPPLERYPPIWAESRQEVCESFDWFRSYQGGVYFVKGYVKGYLLGGFSASRDVFHNNGKLIISHGGGKAESIHKLNGQSETMEASDQMEDDKSVRALLHTYRIKRPLVLLIDDKYRLFPFDIGSKNCTYAVLGWYHIAHAWAEYQSASTTAGRVVRYKFAFQWCENQGQPWWWPSSLQQAAASSLDRSPEASVVADWQTCTSCRKASPTVYKQGWMCLKSGCVAFYQLSDGSAPPKQLAYSEAFLAPVAFHEERMEQLSPSLPGLNLPTDGITTSRHFAKGWHCQKCGRLSSRFKWEFWECRNCGERHGEYGKLRIAAEFKQQKPTKSFDRHWSHNSIIKPDYRLFKCGTVHGTRVTFILPHGRGRIHLLLSHILANGTADDILKKYQEEARDQTLLFRRWPMRAHKCRGTLLTNYFSQNTGEPYQYVGGDANTVPFDRAPSAVVQALGLIKKRMEEAELSEVGFNEVLSAAYMEEQRMAFHSDSERGLGPTVASLSLGAAAYMHFRLHARYAAEEMPGDSSRDVLKLFLRHGDVVVMEGAGVQTFYEHTVMPLNFRIAATARYIGNDHQ